MNSKTEIRESHCSQAHYLLSRVGGFQPLLILQHIELVRVSPASFFRTRLSLLWVEECYWKLIAVMVLHPLIESKSMQ
jgi:hypothetical protein